MLLTSTVWLARRDLSRETQTKPTGENQPSPKAAAGKRSHHLARGSARIQR